MRWLSMALALSLATPRLAEACSCAAEPWISPKDGAVGVPLNVRLFVQHGPDDSVELRRLSDAGPVALTIEDAAAPPYNYFEAVLVRPVEDLAPETVYEAVLRRKINPGPSERVISSFTTGVARDELSPVFAGVTAVRPQRWRADGTRHSSCWGRDNGTDVFVLDHTTHGTDVVGEVIEIWRQDDPTPLWRAMRPVPVYPAETAYTWINSNSCGYTNAPIIDELVTYCGRVTAFDAAGNVAGASAEACGASIDCRITDDELHPGPQASCDSTPFPPVADAAPLPGADDAIPLPAAEGGGGACAIGGTGTRSAAATLLVLCFAFMVSGLARRSRQG